MDYDEWRSEDYDYVQEQECLGCENQKNKLVQSRFFLEEIVEQLYTRSSFDKKKFDHCMEELCHYLNVKYEGKQLQFEKKKEILYISDWMNHNTQFLKQLVK